MARLEYLISQELYPLNVTLVTLQLLLEPLQYQNTHNTQHFYNDGTNVVKSRMMLPDIYLYFHHS